MRVLLPIVTGGLALTSLSASPPHVVPLVVVSVDGLRTADLDDDAYHLPNLRRLRDEGTHASAVTSVDPSVTFPAHTTLVTGVSPSRHGIIANNPFDPTGKNQGGWYWYAEDIHAPTLWDAATGAGLTTGNVSWPVTVGARMTFSVPQIWRAETADDAKLTRAVSTPGLLQEAEAVLGPYPPGERSDVPADTARAALCAWLVEEHRPDLTFCYMTALDYQQHAYGPARPELRETLEATDALVGRIVAAAARRADGPARVVVVSDHGIAHVVRDVQLNVVLAEAGLMKIDDDGDVTSWDAYAWSSGGSAAIWLRTPRDEALRARVRAVLQACVADPELGLEGFRETEPPMSGDEPFALFDVAALTETHLGEKRSGPRVTATNGGGHGFRPAHREMDATFLAAGPGIPAGRTLGRIAMTDVAPTLAALLGLELLQAEGRDVLSAR